MFVMDLENYLQFQTYFYEIYVSCLNYLNISFNDPLLATIALIVKKETGNIMNCLSMGFNTIIMKYSDRLFGASQSESRSVKAYTRFLTSYYTKEKNEIELVIFLQILSRSLYRRYVYG